MESVHRGVIHITVDPAGFVVSLQHGYVCFFVSCISSVDRQFLAILFVSFTPGITISIAVQVASAVLAGSRGRIL